ncbi:glycosyltransferase [Halobacillus litoralis]|uniref:glycosyltransferase n=1 Tax=Halobacillus litoralis TaxID=45668 RepID=UPI001CFF33E5|nr:glycosyltransferase [Halobacillus litoralis]WLR49143.1 glycosyltransferase [Halobacillus litoralis]
MKSKLLFVMPSMHCGGAEKSLISLLESLDYSRYDVDLLLFKREGIFLSKVPSEINILEAPQDYTYFDMPIKRALQSFLKENKFHLIFPRIQAGYLFKTEKNRARCDQKVWPHLSKALGTLDKEYDAAIGYLERSPIYFIIEKVKAHKKIGWIHTHYSNSGMDEMIDRPYFKELDQIVTVSDECKNSLALQFNPLLSKITVINNIVSPDIIKKMASGSFKDLQINKSALNIVTVARLCHVKGIDLAIDACKRLVEKGISVKWHVIGIGSTEENEEYEKMVKDLSLEDSFVFLGIKENPYPYLRMADIYVQPSRYEGKSIAIEEAKILAKPIIITNFNSSRDQIKNGYNGMVVDMTGNDIAQGIYKLFKDEQLREEYIKNLKKESLGNEREVDKLYRILA